MNEAKIAREPTRLSRGEFLRLVSSGVGALTLSSCGVPFVGDQGSLPKAPRTGETGRVRKHNLEAAPLEFDVGGRKVHTWGYDGSVPGPEIRVIEGDTLRAKVLNRLPADTTIHWHGLPVPNAMDGVPHITQPPIKSGEDFTYEFVVPTAGTYVYHSHVGLQLDRGLYGPLIVEPKQEELDYDREAQAQQQYADAFRDHPEFVVPRVIKHSPSVIVSEWIEGRPLSSIIASGSREERNVIGLKYVRFMFSGPKYAGLLHSDPHPGNFRVMADGRLGVVDFGLCARLPDGLPPAIGRLLRISLEGDGIAVRDGLRAEGFIKPRMEIDPDQLMDYLAPFAEPARQETFQFSRAWMRAQANRTSDFRSPSASLALKLNLPPSYLLIHRVWIGGIAVLSQLHAEAPFRSVLEEFLPGFTEE